MRSRSRLQLLFTDDKGGPKVPEQVLTASVRTPVRVGFTISTIGCEREHEFSMLASRSVLLTTASATAALHIGHSPVRHVSVSTITMTSRLHVYDPGSSTALSAYLDKRRCEPAASFDEAPKLAHSIALALDGALDSASLGGGSIAQTIVISEAEDMEVGEACLSALGCPDGFMIRFNYFLKLMLVLL